MSDKKNRLYVYVLGNKGKCAYIITDVNENDLKKEVHSNLLNDNNGSLHQVHSDWVAMIKSLEYIRDNLGLNNIPPEPVIFLFTKYETNYLIANEIHPPKKPMVKKYMKDILTLKKDLKRALQQGEDDNNVSFHFLPNNFVNKMDEVEILLGNEQKKRKPGRH